MNWLKNFINSERFQQVALIAFGLFILCAIIYGIVHYYQKKADLSGELTSHIQCTVTDKDSRKTVRGRAHEPNYYIYSSCGDFKTSQELSDQLEIGYDYDWSATQGNSANKPTILTIDHSY